MPSAPTIVAPLSASTLPGRVLHVMNAAGGGAAISTIELIRELRSSDIDSVAVCDDAGSPSEFKNLNDAVEGRLLVRPLYWWNRKIRAKTWKRPALELLQIAKTRFMRASTADVASFATLHDVDLIHTNTSLTPEGGRAAKQLDLAHVWHFRELIGPQMPFRFPKQGAAFGRHVADIATFVVANSHATAAAITSWLPDDLLRIVPNGINVDKFLSMSPRPIGETVVVGMVANLTSGIKKHDIFLEAASRISADQPIDFRLYGRLPTKPKELNRWHDRIASLGLTGRFRFAGFIADTREIMSDIDILVHTSDAESFGRVAVEAMAACRPVVGVAGGGVGEIVIHETTGLLSPPGNAELLAENIRRLANDRELRTRLGVNGRARAQSEYTVRRCAANIMNVYEEALTKKARQRSPERFSSRPQP